MDKLTLGIFRFIKRLKYLGKSIKRFIFLVLAAFMIGFSNALFHEERMLGDIRNFVQEEQVYDDEDMYE